MGWIDWLFPVTCAGCGVRAGEGLCARCRATLRPVPAMPPPPPGVDAWYAAVAYEGAAREAVARLKYRNARAPLDLLVARLDAALPADAGPVHAVTWVPTTATRRRSRGFDQAELLARALARRRDLPVQRLLRRTGRHPQTGLDAVARAQGPAFVARGPAPAAVLLVDDVITTGASMRNAARALRAKGCEKVIGVGVARTLLKGVADHSEKPNKGGTATIRSHHAGSNARMQTTAHGGHLQRSVPGEPFDRETRVRRIGAQVKDGTYRPPIDSVVESLVMALLPHFRARG